ncbi:MAG: NAD(P)/FAD-dependent oxidoreductase [Actinomycetes bacterium]
MTEVLVAGGGPVGLAAALAARRRGLGATVVEPRRVPVDKACGEGLMPGTVRVLESLGVEVDALAGMPFRGIRYVGPDGTTRVSHAFVAGPGRGVRRTALHAALADVAGAAGVRLVTTRVDDVVQDGARVRAALADGGHLDGDWLLACDGLHSPLRRALGLHGGSDGRRFGVRRHAAVAPWTDHVEVHWSSLGEAYVTPVGPDEVGVAVLGARGVSFEGALATFPALAPRLAGCAWTSPARGAGPLRQRVRGRVSGRVLLVGDAAGYVDALTGEGLRIGLASALAAVDALAAGEPRRYERVWRRTTRDYRWLTSGLVAATRSPLVRGALVPAAARLPRLFGGAVETLAA